MNEISSELKRIISNVLECSENSITEQSGFTTHPGWDSLHHVMIISEIEKYYGIRIQDQDIENLINFSHLCDFLKKNIQ